MTDSLENLTEKLRSTTLCALPQSAVQMIQLSKDPNNGPKEYAIPISADLGLSTQVLRFVNSSFFGFRNKITSVHMALSLASVRTISNFVLWSGLFAIMPNPKCGPFSIHVLFQDSLRRGVFTKHICEALGDIDQDEAFLGAILQDMSIPIVGKMWNKEYTEMITGCKDVFSQLYLQEQKQFGWDHAKVSAILVKLWNLDDRISELISSHHVFDFTKIESQQDKQKAVTTLSALLPSVISQHWCEIEQFIFAFNSLFHNRVPDLEQILRKTDDDSYELMQLISLGNKPSKLIDYLQDYYSSFKNLIPVDHDLTSQATNTDIPITA